MPATVSSFYVSVLYTAMLWTSIAAVVLRCFYFCPLDFDASVMLVDCAAVETGCMLEKYVPGKGFNKTRVHFYFLVEVLLLPTTSVLKRGEVTASVSLFPVSTTTTAVSLTFILLLLLRLRRDACAKKTKKGITFFSWWLCCCCFSLTDKDVLQKIRLVFAFCFIRVRN